MNLLRTLSTIGFLAILSLTGYAQNLNSKYTSDINGLRIHQPHTKQEIIAKFGTPTEYNRTDYTDEGLGIDEEYIYGEEFKIYCTDGNITKISSDSSKYLFFNHIKVGDNVSKAHEMINDGWARKGIITSEENGYYLMHLYLGDMSFFVYYRNNIIEGLLYNVPM